MKYLQAIEIETQNRPANAAVIWLHGLGASGDDFAPIVPQLKLDASIAARFVFPHAPSRPITINNGMAMPAWYDFTIEGVERKINQTDLAETTQQIVDLIEREVERGIDSERIILAGFSQGGAIAYEVVLKANIKLAGLMAMSTYIPDLEKVSTTLLAKNFPMHIYHGDQDQVVPESLGRQALSSLEENGFKPGFSLYPMEHSVCLSQIRDITKFLNATLMNQ